MIRAKIDINECEVNNGGCSDVCINTVGSFMCTCSAGFEFASGSGSESDPICLGL